MQEPGSDELYWGCSLEDLNGCAELTASEALSEEANESDYSVIATSDPQVLVELAKHLYGNAIGHEKNGDMEMAYFYARVSHLLLTMTDEPGTPEEELERQEGEGWEGELDASQFHARWGHDLHSRYNKRSRKAAAAIKLGVKTELAKVLASPSPSQSSLSGRPTLAPRLRRAAPGNRVDQEAAATFRNSTAEHESTSSDVGGKTVKSDSQQPHQLNPEYQISRSSIPLGREQSSRKHDEALQHGRTDLYLGRSLGDLDECARAYTSRHADETNAEHLKEAARHVYSNALGQEECQDLEMAYVYCEIARLLVMAAADLCPSGNSEDVSRRVFGATTDRDLSSTHTRLKEALQSRFDRRIERAVAASKMWPRIKTQFFLALGISSLRPRTAVQVSESDLTVEFFQPVHPYEDGGATSKHEMTTIKTTNPGETHQQDDLTSICMPSLAEKRENADVFNPLERLFSVILTLPPLLESKRQQGIVDFRTDLEASIANLKPIIGKNKGNDEVAAIEKTAVNFAMAIIEVLETTLQTSIGQSPPNKRNHNYSDSSSTDPNAIATGSTNDTEKKPEPGLIGIRNTGTSCYLISVVQCLSNTPQVTHMLKEIQGLTPDRKKEAVIATELGSLLSDLRKGKTADITNFMEVLGSLWVGYERDRQQDAHELLNVLLNQLIQDLGMRPNAREGRALRDTSHDASELHEDSSLGTDESGESKERDWTIVDKLFRGTTTSTLTCVTCGGVSSKPDSFLYLPLEIPPGNRRCSLQECLDRYLRLEDLDDATCRHCHRKGGMKKKVDICGLPPILTIWFKRFQPRCDGHLDANSPTAHEKLNTLVDFPLDSFRVDPQDVSQNVYSLVAVTNHYGDLSGGHYTAFCKNDAQQTWYKFDDSKVNRLLDSDIVTSQAYLLFYSATSDQQGVA